MCRRGGTNRDLDLIKIWVYRGGDTAKALNVKKINKKLSYFFSNDITVVEKFIFQ